MRSVFRKINGEKRERSERTSNSETFEELDRPSRCLARVHAHTHARTSTSHVLATWKRDTDLSPTIELLREREKLGGRERGEDEKEGFEASRIEQI